LAHQRPSITPGAPGGHVLGDLLQDLCYARRTMAARPGSRRRAVAPGGGRRGVLAGGARVESGADDGAATLLAGYHRGRGGRGGSIPKEQDFSILTISPSHQPY